MVLKLAVTGAEPGFKTRKGADMPFCFGMEAAPATMRQVFKFVPERGVALPQAGSTVTINVSKVTGATDGSLWLRGSLVNGK